MTSPRFPFTRSALLAGALSLTCAGLGCTEPPSSATPPMPPLPRNVGQALTTGTRTPPVPAAEPASEKGPKVADPATAFAQLLGKSLLPGDQAIAERLALEMQGAQKPAFKSNVDYPFDDGAAHAISEEARRWVRAKMAALGFAETPGKPSLLWVIHVQPGVEGRYLLETSLSAEGSVKFSKTFVVPAQFSSTRMDEVFAADFAPGLP